MGRDHANDDWPEGTAGYYVCEDGVPSPRGFARWLDGASVTFFLFATAWSIGMLGATRTWSFAIGLVLVLLGILTSALRLAIVDRTPSWRMPWFGWVFVALTAYVVVRDTSAPAVVAARWDLLKWASLLGLGLAWMQLARVSQRWKLVLVFLFVIGALEAFYGIYQYVTDSREVCWMERPEQYLNRVSGTFLCPNHFANVLAILIPVALAVLFAPGAGLPLKMLGIYYLAAALPALVWSLSRSAMAGTLLGLGAMAMLWIWRSSRKVFFLSLIAVPLVMAAVAWVALESFPTLKERFDKPFSSDSASWMARSNMWHDSPAMWEASPVVGHGGGQWVWAYPKYQHHAKLALTYDYPHNEYVQVLVEYGAVGAGLLVAAMLCAAIAWMVAMRRLRDPAKAWLLAGAGGAVVASASHALFDFNFHIFPSPVLLLTVCGVAWGVARSETDAESDPAKASPRWSRIALGTVVALLAVWCGIWTVKGGMGYWRTLEGEMLRTHNRGDEAEAKYRAAMDWDDANEQPYDGMAELRMSQATWCRDGDRRTALAAEAEAFSRAAVARNPLDAFAVYGIARARKLQNDPEGALDAMFEASALQPMNRFYSTQVAVQLRAMGRTDAAAAWLRDLREQGIAGSRAMQQLQSIERESAR